MTLLRAATALACGAALPLGFAPYDYYLIVFPCLAVLFFLWDDAAPLEGSALGALFGCGMFGHGVWWVQVSVHQFGLPLYTFSISVTAGFVLLLCAYPALCGFVAGRAREAPLNLRMLLLFPAIWTLSEVLRSWLFTGFPWLLLGYSQVDSPLAVYAPLVGVTGLSLISALVAGCLVVLVRGEVRARAVTAAILGAIALGALVLNTQAFTQVNGSAESVALVQGAVPQAVKWSSDNRDPSIDLYSHLSEQHWGKFLIVWPETAIPAFAEEVPEVMAALNARAAASGSALLVGMPAGDPLTRGRYFNSVVQFGAGTGRYDKRHLVPFGEYLPFDRWLRPLLDFLRIPMSSFTSGPDAQALLRANGHVLGVSICFEDAFAREIARALPQASLLVNVSNDAWFGESIAPHQHLQIARMRALEAGRYLLRATNTGISAIIDERGNVIARSKQFVPDVVSGVVIPRSGLTPAARYGILFPLLLCAAMLAGFSFASWRNSSTRPK